MTQHTLNGDVHGPNAIQEFLNTVAATFADISTTDEQSGAALADQGVSGPAVDLTAAMHAASTAVSSASTGRATRFAGHVARRDEHISDDLAGTQAGKYLDPAAL